MDMEYGHGYGNVDNNNQTNDIIFDDAVIVEDDTVIVEPINNQTSKGQVVEYTDFNRVNFDDPTTILRYGTDLLNEMGELMKDVSTMMRRDDVDMTELNSKIEKLTTFNDELDELDEKKQQQLVPANGIVKTISKVASLLKVKLSGEEEATSYADQFDKYTENIDLLGAYVEEQKNNTIADINMYKEFIKAMKPYELKLDNLIKVGEQDLKNYETKINEIEKTAIANGDTDAVREVSLAKQKMEIFRRKLLELGKNLSLIKNTIQECEMKQGPDMELVFMYDSYVNTTLPVLKVQATSMIGVRRQAAALANHKQLVDATNEAAKKNSQMLVGNIQTATDLSMEGNIKMDTLKELAANIEKGVQILKDGNALRSKKMEADKKMLTELNEAIDSATEGTVGLFTHNIIDEPEVFETHNYPSVSELKPKQKRFKMLPNIKKGN